MSVTLKKINPLDQYQHQRSFAIFANIINASNISTVVKDVDIAIKDEHGNL